MEGEDVHQPHISDTEEPGERELSSVSSPSELCINQIKSHLEYYERERNGLNEAPPSGASSLATLAAGRVVKALREDSTPESVQILLDSCPPNLLATISENHSLHYSTYRRFGKVQATTGGEPLHIDEWVFENERMIRRLPERQWGRYLVKLDDGDSVWPESEVLDGGIRVLTRKNSPREHLAILGEARERKLRILGDTVAFKANFHRLTGGVLDGLNWDNVFVAGGMALSCLMCVKPEMEKNYISSDIDLYIYGLKPEEATKKAEEVFELWSKNLGPDKTKFVVRNSKTFTFMSDYPERRIQIILKLVPSPAGILLNFDLDQCAIGWNGTDVLMLPRCARALETGYSVFTADLIHGHYLGDRRATQERRVFKYADKGFGILFLSRLLQTTTIDFMKRYRETNRMEGGEKEKRRMYPIMKGKKAVMRIAYMAKDTVHRFYIGPTEATPLTDGYGDLMEGYDPEQDEYIIHKERGILPDASYSQLNGSSQHIGRPSGRLGLKMFETFMRMVTMWSYDRAGMISLIKDSFESTDYGDGYDELLHYIWDKDFKHSNFARLYEQYNHNLFSVLQVTIRRIDDNRPPYTWYTSDKETWQGYLARRIRRMVTGSTLSEVLKYQLTLALWVPDDLETYISSLMSEVRATHNLPETDEFKVLIPAVSASRAADSNPPPPPDILAWKLRFWVVGNTTTWARLDRRIDEVFEVLWTLFHFEMRDEHRATRLVPPLSNDDLTGFTRTLRELLARRPVPRLPSSGDKTWPDKREIWLWRDWLFGTPQYVGRHYTYEAHSRYQEHFYFAPPDEWYWKGDVMEGDAGVWTEWNEERETASDSEMVG